MADEGVKTKDEVSLVLYDKNGKVKQTSVLQKGKQSSKLELLLKFIGKVLEKW